MVRWKNRGNPAWITPGCSRMPPLDAKVASESMISDENYMELRPTKRRACCPNLCLVANV
jgi:hypothetical protein